MSSNMDFKNLTIASYVACIVFTILAVFLVWVFMRKLLHNRYTKIAYLELVIALVLRIAACAVFAWFSNSRSNKLSSSLFSELFFILPYYLVIKIAFALVFGWITLYSVLNNIANISV